ncbi:hypothetical protein JAAARDRAFT_32711 [Jaapia argillacea MUCL 33604]|uniref:RING-type domain-containing protein n=1 Tax=Jaapia argillacea MUCL 33604 TaxID=933084 RepID=A0A067Q9Y4_9AGAM|nr:hypothetical protein JAAARDRAFT_32711 [Jaapia argillacea MUCL 33604]
MSLSLSPEIRKGGEKANNSIADVAGNWRTRAKENGIRVAPPTSQREPRYVDDDEATENTFADSSLHFSNNNDQALLPPAFVSSQRRSRAYSQSSLPTQQTAVNVSQVPYTPDRNILPRADRLSHTPDRLSYTPDCHVSYPSDLGNPNLTYANTPDRASKSSFNYTPDHRRTLADLNTPPPKANDVNRLKLKGSLTDPAYTRRRPIFGQPTAELFDIDEDEYSHAPYPQTFTSSPAPNRLQGHVPTPLPKLNLNPNLSLTDPFYARSLSPIDEAAFHYNYGCDEEVEFDLGPDFGALGRSLPLAFLQNQTQTCHLSNTSLPAQMSSSPHRSLPQLAGQQCKQSTIDKSSCSVCERSPSSLAVLEPCGHPLCSACLTSALNIVGEKDMRCAVCKRGVEDFKLAAVERDSSISSPSAERKLKEGLDASLSSSLDTKLGGEEGLMSAFEADSQFGDDDAGVEAFFNRAQGASTPVGNSPAKSAGGGSKTNGDHPVLRIDNVPWDITPPAIITFLSPHAVHRAHVLLDRKGKTLSHAFVEMEDEEATKAALRSVGNRVLGKGRRARGVTVTRSWEGELKAGVFGKDTEGGKGDAGMGASSIGREELEGLVRLIRAPDSHFLKVPSLPFYSLVSILAKFPTDVDAMTVAKRSDVRDLLYDVTYSALQVLLSRLQENKNPSVEEGNEELLVELFEVALACRAFTPQQAASFAELADTVPSLPIRIPSPPPNAHHSIQAPIVAPLPAPMTTPAHVHAPDTYRQHLHHHQLLGPQHPAQFMRPSHDIGLGLDPRFLNHQQQYASQHQHQLMNHRGSNQIPMQMSMQMQGMQVDPFSAIAREFGVQPDLVEALAQRLSAMC